LEHIPIKLDNLCMKDTGKRTSLLQIKNIDLF
jgi:hypothetical protein